MYTYINVNQFGGGSFDLNIGAPGLQPRQPQSIHVDYMLSLENIETGGHFQVEIKRPKRCPACQGRGTTPEHLTTCPACGNDVGR